MSDRYLTTSEFLADAAAWDKKRRAMRRAAFFSGIFNIFMSLFSIVFIALTCVTIAGPGLLALAAFFGIAPT